MSQYLVGLSDGPYGNWKRGYPTQVLFQTTTTCPPGWILTEPQPGISTCVELIPDRIVDAFISVAGKKTNKVERKRSAKMNITFEVGAPLGGDVMFRVTTFKIKRPDSPPLRVIDTVKFDRAEEGKFELLNLEWAEGLPAGKYTVTVDMIFVGKLKAGGLAGLTPVDGTDELLLSQTVMDYEVLPEVVGTDPTTGETKEISHFLIQLKVTSPIVIFQGFNNFVIWLAGITTKVFQGVINALSGLTGTRVMGVESEGDTLKVYVDERSPLGPLIIPLILGALVLLGLAVVAYTVTNIGQQKVEEQKQERFESVEEQVNKAVEEGSMTPAEGAALLSALANKQLDTQTPESPFGDIFGPIKQYLPLIVGVVVASIAVPPLIGAFRRRD